MPEITEDLTPSQIVLELDRYIVGQAAAKRAVAVALRNRYRRRLMPDDLRDEVIPKNILMIGPTGVGKTEIARRLATLAAAPFVKVEATKFTEVGYVGRDVDSMIRDLTQVAARLVEAEKRTEVRPEAQRRAIERLLDILQPASGESAAAKQRPREGEPGDVMAQMRRLVGSIFSSEDGPVVAPTVPEPPAEPEAELTPEAADKKKRDAERRARIRERLKEQLLAGTRDEELISVTVADRGRPPMMQFFGPQGMEEMGMDMSSSLGGMMPQKRRTRKMTIGEAKAVFTEEEAAAIIDRDAVMKDAVLRTEQTGIVFVDEIDKIAGKSGPGGAGGPDVSREGVQRDILPILEGSTVNTKYGPVKTDHILFIAAGAFHVSKPSDLIPELQGRLPIRVELENLNQDDFERILVEPRNALTRQYTGLLATEGVTLEFTAEGIAEIARVAAAVNRSSENIGARRLHTVMEKLLEDVSFDAPDLDSPVIHIDDEYVRTRLSKIASDEDLSRYIL
ncbi:MAG: ATP-dependent protease ATPase subunit HslU [Armatimonadetes bacterium]|nr:ATP-dependent protease ATPase subunit HslU [Armatimonadota bacterium]MDE2205372.1 ATP-dependent protease ATPase subunit HslU [Armatimonadota bacterium]